MSKKLRMILTGILFSLVFTFGIALVNTEDAKADWYFSRTKIDKCKVTLERNHYDWDGKAHFPKVFVYDKDKLLVENVDYELAYYNNKDAGDAYVKIKGIGKYRGSRKAYFEIEGIDIETECTFEVKSGLVYVYYNDKLISASNYTVSKHQRGKKEVRREPGTNRNNEYIVYEVTTEYVIYGENQYSGTATIYDVAEERELVKRDEDDRPQPGPGGPGHGPGPQPGPGGPGHGPGPQPGPGGPGHGQRP